MSNITRLLVTSFTEELMPGADKSCTPYGEDGCVVSQLW